MKLLTACLLGALSLACAQENANPSPRFAYLIFPGRTNTTRGSATTTPSPSDGTTQSTQAERENLESLSDETMSRLRQQQGSEGGVYHVYLPDGTLQRVQYTAAPISTSQQGQSQAESERQQQNVDLGAIQGIYYVQVPQERLEEFNLLNQQQNGFAQLNQASNDSQSTVSGQDRNASEDNATTTTDASTNKSSNAQQKPATAEYRNAAEEVNAQFVPLRFLSAQQFQQGFSGNYAQQGSSGNNPRQGSDNRNAQEAQAQQFQQGYSANYAQQGSSGNNPRQGSDNRNAQEARYAPAQQFQQGYNNNNAQQGFENTVEKARYVPAQQFQQGFSGNYAQQQDSSNAQQAATAEGPYLANVRFSQVEPITGPVFAYSPQQLVRILRRA